jgi:hypothetical protein
MTKISPQLKLTRALELSRELLALAERGEVAQAVELDHERGQLLRSALGNAQLVRAADHAVLRQIEELNLSALKHLEQARLSKWQALQLANQGQRAVRAYSNVQRP